MQTYMNHPFAQILIDWGTNKNHAAELTEMYIGSHEILTPRELQALALLPIGDVFKLTIRWFGTTLAPVARAHLVVALKTNRDLIS
jgi:hypothetical protein